MRTSNSRSDSGKPVREAWWRHQLRRCYPLYVVSKVCQMAFPAMRSVLSLPFLVDPGTDPPSAKFVILGQTRSGTHVLGDLLNSHTGIHCDEELFDRDIPRLMSPELYVEAKRKRFKRQAYGFILHLRHLLMMKDLEQGAFLSHLHESGWRIIHVHRRNVVRQQVSLEVGKQRRTWHVTSQDAVPPGKVRIDTDDFVRRIRLREIKSALEAELLAHYSPLPVVYEDDLLDAENHQSTLDRAFGYLGVPSMPVSTALVRTSRDSLRDMIDNYAEFEEAVAGAGCAEYLSQSSADANPGRAHAMDDSEVPK